MGYLEFEIEDFDIYGTGKVPFSNMGVAFMQATWQFMPDAKDADYLA